MELICQGILYFTIYSFLGWMCECVYCSVPAKKFINRGFLAGPVCPVYGFGALLVILALQPVADRAVLVFLAGMVLTSALEYLTSVILEKLFHMKWWDYSHYRFNIHGRVCLLNSVLFGLLCVVVVMGIHPHVAARVGRIPPLGQAMLAGVILGMFACDCWISVRTTLEVSGKLEQLRLAAAELKERTDSYRDQFQQGLEQKLEQLREDRDWEARRAAAAERIEQMKARIAELSSESRLLHRRLIDAFPNLRSTRDETVMEKVREAIREMREVRRQNKHNQGKD